MAVKIRLSRVGRKDVPMYRIVAADARVKRDGKILANVGTYDGVNGRVIQFHEDVYVDFIKKGAQVSDSAKRIHKIFKQNGIYVPKKAEKVRIQPVKATAEGSESAIE